MLEMEACWPSGVALRGEASNHRMLRWLKTVVVSDPEKARLTRQVGTRKTFQKRPPGRPGGRALLRRREHKRRSASKAGDLVVLSR